MKDFDVRLLPRFLFIAALAVPLAETASAVEFAAHRAIYRVTLESAPPGGVSDVSGNMSVDWQDACSGWTFEYHSLIDVTQAETGGIRLSTVATTWEATDGSEYRFNVRHSTNGHEMERVEGYGAIEKPGGEGTVTFTEPEERTLSLPKGTLFPLAHSLAVMRAAKTGKKPVIMPRSVFDGMDEQGLYLVNAVIGGAVIGGERAGSPRKSSSPAAVVKQLRGHRTWPVALAYFKAGANDPAPSHEMSMMMYDNGVADQLVMDFADFTIRASLERLELQPQSDCGE